MKRTSLATALLLVAAGAGAEPVRCVDANGKVRYVDSSMAGNDKCSPISNDMQVVPGGQSGSGGYVPPSSLPSSSGGNPSEARLREAQAELTEAQRKLAEQEAIRTGDEKNYQRVLDRLKPYQEAVERAQQKLERAQRDAK